MSAYYFIENKNPTSDPNLDLNFDNDLLFSDIIADDYDKYKEAHVINESISPRVPAKRPPSQKQQQKLLSKRTNTNIYVVFIIIVIIAIFLWYIYGGKPKDKNNQDVLLTSPDLVMLSPDFGTGARLGSIF